MGKWNTWIIGAAVSGVGGCHAELPEAVSDVTTSGIPADDSSGQGSEATMKLDLPVGEESGTGRASDGEHDSCPDVAAVVEQVIPTIVLQVDQSGSMEEDFSGQSRWAALYETLMGDGGVVASLESSVRFGVALYSSTNGFQGGACPMLSEVAPALNNFSAIDATYAAANPIDDTPTGESLDAIAAGLVAYDEPGPKVIVVATDGEPDTCDEPDPQNGQAQVISAVQSAFNQGIEVYAISVGNDVGAPHLQDVANAGVGKALDDPNPAPFYVALDAADLIEAFEQIISEVISCEIPINGIVDIAQGCDGLVKLDDVELECGADWGMLDSSTLELHGDACLTLKDGQSHEVTATWPCSVINIP